MPTTPLLIEYKVAFEILSSKSNSLKANFLDMLSSGEAVLCEDEFDDYKKCKVCNQLCKSHTASFRKVIASDLPVHKALQQKMVSKGQLNGVGLFALSPALRFVGIAIRQDLTCVLAPATEVSLHHKVCKAGSVSVMSSDEFKAMLSSLP